MGKKGKKKASKEDPNSRTVCQNRKARHNYEILDTLDCGIVLAGSEVKSIRANKISIEEAFARVQDGEVWLYNCDIALYPQANTMNHQTRRPRKLLMKRAEIRKFAERAENTSLTLIPLSVYFTRGLVKVKLGIAKGRKLHDKREKLKKDSARMDIQRAMRARNN